MHGLKATVSRKLKVKNASWIVATEPQIMKNAQKTKSDTSTKTFYLKSKKFQLFPQKHFI